MQKKSVELKTDEPNNFFLLSVIFRGIDGAPGGEITFDQFRPMSLLLFGPTFYLL